MQEVMVLKSLPDVSLENLDSKSVDLKSFLKNKNTTHVFIHFWATWCAPCEVEFPDLLDFINNANSKNTSFVIIAVNDEVKKIKRFLKRFESKINLDNIHFFIDNKSEYYNKFGTAKVPESYIFNNQSFETVKKFIGPQEWKNPSYLKYLESL